MKAEAKVRICAALRSGEYSQGRGMLYDGKGYCCLGVMAKVYGAEIKGAMLEAIYLGKSDRGLSHFLPSNLAEEIGIAPHEESILVNKNDHDRLTFSEIADYIETLPNT